MALLIVGGLIGFLKAGSKVSLIMSLVFVALFLLCQLAIFHPTVANVLLGILLFFFAFRFLKIKKVMPAGMMAVLTLVTLILRVSL